VQCGIHQAFTRLPVNLTLLLPYTNN